VSGDVLILGGGSEIGLALARAWAGEGRTIRLAARQTARLAPEIERLRASGAAEVTTHEWDVLDAGSTTRLFDGLPRTPEIVVMAVGLYDHPDRDLLMRSNFNGPALAVEAAARYLGASGGGWIVGISSVAGDRGRASNYPYGAAKAGFTAWLSGLRARLHGKSVRVMTVKPGPVATRMIAGRSVPAPLLCSADRVASAVVAAHRAGREVVYVPWFWRPIMAAVRALPEPLFKRLRLG